MQINQKVHLPCSSHENLRVCVPINSHRIMWPMISRCFESQAYWDYNNNATRVHKDTDMHTSSSQTTIMRNGHNRSKQNSALLTLWNLQLRMLERSRMKGEHHIKAATYIVLHSTSWAEIIIHKAGKNTNLMVTLLLLLTISLETKPLLREEEEEEASTIFFPLNLLPDTRVTGATKAPVTLMADTHAITH